MPRIVTRAEFDRAVEALWSEIDYQNNLERRTDAGEAKDIGGFATCGRVYLRHMEDAWNNNAGVPDDCLHDLRKLSAVFMRGMIYCGIIQRKRGARRRSFIDKPRNSD